MYFRPALVLVVAFVGLAGSGCGQEGADRGDARSTSGGEIAAPAEAEQEAARMVVELFTENRDLKEQVEGLSGQVEALQQRLAETMARLDLVQVEAGRPARTPPPPTDVMVDDLTRVRVLEVNREMQVVVVSGGLQAGMKTGMRFHVLRDEKMIGQIRLIDVRDTIAGGLIERTEKNGFPETGDRVILSSKQDG